MIEYTTYDEKEMILNGSMRCALTIPIHLEGVLTHSQPPGSSIFDPFPRTWVVQKAGFKQIILEDMWPTKNGQQPLRPPQQILTGGFINASNFASPFFEGRPSWT